MAPVVVLCDFMGTVVHVHEYKGTPCVYASSEFPFKINQGVEFFVFPFHPTIFDKKENNLGELQFLLLPTTIWACGVVRVKIAFPEMSPYSMNSKSQPHQS